MSATIKRANERSPTPAEQVANTNEAAFFELRQGGVSSSEAGRRLGLSVAQLDRLRGIYAAEAGNGLSTDSSCPKFALHGRHVAAVLNLGGFVRRERLPSGALVEVRP